MGSFMTNGNLPRQDTLHLRQEDRILILAPHPDDEILGCAGVVEQAKKMGIPLKIVFLTYGDNNQWSFLVYRKHPVVMPKAAEAMGMIRHDEALKADDSLGVTPDEAVFLGYPDFRTFEIWSARWGNSPPAKSMLTEARAVPYDNAFRPGAPYKGEEIEADLKAIIKAFKPTKIFVSHPADHNGDHQALYLFTRVALWDLGEEIKPRLYPYLIHFKKWPLPRGYHPARPLLPPDFFAGKIPWDTLPLDADQVVLKHKAIKLHRSQYRSSAQYLLSFIRANELFGDFPAVALTQKKVSFALVPSRDEELREFPEELVDQERASFVGVKEEYVSREDDSIVFSIRFSKPLGKEVGVSLFIFGYKRGILFEAMPKLHLKFGSLGFLVLDQKRRLRAHNIIQVVRRAKEITIRVPLSLLQNPDKILINTTTYLGNVPLDVVSWRIIEL